MFTTLKVINNDLKIIGALGRVWFWVELVVASEAIWPVPISTSSTGPEGVWGQQDYAQFMLGRMYLKAGSP